MATIIDSLIVELGLDASKLDEGQRDVVGKLKTLTAATQAHLKPVEQGFNQLIGTFKEFQSRLLGIGALIAGGIGLDRLVGDIARANAQTGYLAKSLGLTTKELSVWQAAGRTMGVSPDDSVSGLTKLKEVYAERSTMGTGPLFRLGGSFPKLGERLNKLGPNASPTDVAMALSEWAQKEEKDPNRARFMLQSIGMSQGMTNMIMQGPEKLGKMLKEAEQYGVNEDQVKTFQELVKAFGNLTNAADKLARALASNPEIIKFLDSLTTIINAFSNKGAAAGAQTLNEEASKGTGSFFGDMWGGTKKLIQRANPWGSGASGGGVTGGPGGGGPSPAGGSSFNDRFHFGQPGGANPAPAAGGAPMSYAAPGTVGSGASGGPSGGGPTSDQGNRPFYMGGTGFMEGYGKFHWGSGGAGKGSIPYGDYPITPNEMGPWGQAHGAVGLNHNSIFDPKTGGMRGGIELHASSSADLDHLYTLGCFAVPQSEWPRFKQHLLSEIATKGPMYLHVGKDGARITHQNESKLPKWLPSAGSKPIGTFGQWRKGQDSLSRPTPGANGSTTHNSSSSQTSIGQMHVTVPQGASPEEYADGIKEHLQRNDPVLNSMTGMN